MDSAATSRWAGMSPFADSAKEPSPSHVSMVSTDASSVAAGPPRAFISDQIPTHVLLQSPPQDLQEFFLDNDAVVPPSVSQVAAEPDSDDEVLAEILFRGRSISAAGVVFVDDLPDDEIADPRVKAEPVPESPSSPAMTRRKHLGVR
ncbi:hypothetical protein Tco_0402882, partial [Tanacetum coccineum]